jgi:hypothetical protein
MPDTGKSFFFLYVVTLYFQPFNDHYFTVTLLSNWIHNMLIFSNSVSCIIVYKDAVKGAK